MSRPELWLIALLPIGVQMLLIGRCVELRTHVKSRDNVTSFVATGRRLPGYCPASDSGYRSLISLPPRRIHSPQRHPHTMGTVAARSIFRNGTHSLTRPAVTTTFTHPRLAK